MTRALVLRARVGMADEEKAASAPKASAEDFLKPLPPSDIADVWEAGELACNGLSTVLTDT